jgi:cell division protein FtsL
MSNNSPLETLAAFAIVFALGVLSTALLAYQLRGNTFDRRP